MGRRLTGLGLTVERTHAAKAAATRPVAWLRPNAAETGPAEMLVLVGDRLGRVLGELNVWVDGVVWKLNDYGQSRMSMSRTEAQRVIPLLAFGNRVLILFGNGLPAWGGVMDPPRKGESGRIEIVAYSMEYWLKQRITDRGRYFNQATAGEIFRALLQEAADLGIEVGSVWLGGLAHSPDYHLDGLLDIVQKSLTKRIENADWEVTARLQEGRIAFAAHYYERRGVDHGRRLALLEGVNLTREKLNEQGDIANEWVLAGAGTGWGETTRIYSKARDEASIARYGLRQRGDVRTDVTVQATLDAHARTALAESAEPQRVISFEALDRSPARFGEYDVGDSLWVELYEQGLSGHAGPVRVTAREYLPGSNTCAMVVK